MSQQRKKKRKSSKVRIRPIRLLLVIVIGLSLIWGFFWSIFKFVTILWGLLSQIHLFPTREPIESTPTQEQVVVEEDINDSEVVEKPSQKPSSTNKPSIDLPTIVSTDTFSIVPNQAKETPHPFTYNEVQTQKLLSLKEKATNGNLKDGVAFESGLMVQLGDVAFVEATNREGIKITYQLTNASDDTQTLSQSLESSWQTHLLLGETILKEQIAFYEDTITAVYPFQYLAQSFKNNYAMDHEYDSNERSCNDAITLESNQATTCSLIYDYVGVGDYDILIQQAGEVYQIPISIEYQTTESKQKNEED